MENNLLAYWLRWPSFEWLVETYQWAWPLCEIVHFFGLILLFAGVGTFDLRVLGIGKKLPPAILSRALPWGVFGFILCVASGSIFVGGIIGNVGIHPYTVLMTNLWLQLKLLFIALAGLNLLGFYLTGMAKLTETMGPDTDAPPLAKVFCAISLVLWVGVVYVGRLIPWEL